MKPIGIALKNTKTNPFTGRTSGELMIVHQCLSCDKISCNRIAGDDNSYTLISLLEASSELDTLTTDRLNDFGIDLKTRKDSQEILTALFGYDYQKYLNKK